MDAPRGFSRYLGIAERFLARGRVPALLIAVARKRSRLKLVKSDLRLLQELWWPGFAANTADSAARRCSR